MVYLIVGEKGKGKTKILLDKVNTEIKQITGNIVYLDKSTKHMYELNNKIRLIDASQCMIDNTDQFLGFVSGIISQDHDLQQVYLDSFMKIACIENNDITAAVDKLDKLGKAFDVDFIISVSMDAEALPESLKDKVLAAL
jgi:hypothetical protein